MQADDGSRASLERRIEMEVSRIQTQSLAELEKVRSESQTALERETRMLRDMREQALAQLDLSRAEGKGHRDAYDELLLRHRELQRRTDVELSRLSADLQLRGGEADRLVVCPL